MDRLDGFVCDLGSKIPDFSPYKQREITRICSSLLSPQTLHIRQTAIDSLHKPSRALAAAMVTHKIDSLLLTFERKRAIILLDLEGGGFMPNTIPSGQLIKLLHDRLEKQANTLRGKDLTMMQISVLMELQEAEQMQHSMKELERKFCVAQSTVAGIISRLEQKGFVEAFGDASEKRIKLVHITPDGEVCCREAAGYMAEAEQMLLHGFSEDEKALFNQLLARAAENMK